MLTSQQVRNLQALHDLLPEQHHVGPTDAPAVGARYHCGGGRPYWLFDVSTVEFARELAVRTEPRCRRRSNVLGLPMGRRMDPLVEHYGMNAEQIRVINEIDALPIPDAEHQGREVWIERLQTHLRGIIVAGAPDPNPAYINHYETVVTLRATSGDHDGTAPPEQIAANAPTRVR